MSNEMATSSFTRPFYRFATFSITNQVFYQSSLSLALVNLKPLVPGHVLVIPKRVVPRFTELTSDETIDLFLSVKKISKLIENEYKAQSMNIAIQDGALAGQSVPHVHVHLIPRRKEDFEPMDEVYTALDSLNMYADYLSRQSRQARKKVFGVDDEDRKARSKQEMKKEAQRLSCLVEDEKERGVFDDEQEEE